jgi:hypothetical protein
METIHFVDTTIRDGMKLGMRSINSALASLAVRRIRRARFD